MSLRLRLLLPALLSVAYAAARLAAVRRVRRFETLSPEEMDLPSALFYIRGRRVHLTIEGEGPPLLLVHGFRASGLAFRPLAEILRRHYTLVIPDLPGHGYSDRSHEADYSYEGQAGLLLELLDRLAIGRAAVLGHATGAAIALRMAAGAPERVPALILAGGPGAREPVVPALLRPLLPLLVPVVAQSRTALRLANRLAGSPGHREDPALVEAYRDAARVRGHAAAMVTILGRTLHGPPPAPEQIAAPTLVIAGAADRYLSPCRAQRLAARLADGRALVVPDAGHLVLEEQPALCAVAIVEFLAASRRTGAPQPDRAQREQAVPGREARS